MDGGFVVEPTGLDLPAERGLSVEARPAEAEDVVDVEREGGFTIHPLVTIGEECLLVILSLVFELFRLPFAVVEPTGLDLPAERGQSGKKSLTCNWTPRCRKLKIMRVRQKLKMW
nr:hypothetical protein [Tanacetum cinerariifolium]